MGSKFCVPFEILHKILSGIKNLTIYDILELWHLKSWWDASQVFLINS